jgi:hypothetical protein
MLIYFKAGPGQVGATYVFVFTIGLDYVSGSRKTKNIAHAGVKDALKRAVLTAAASHIAAGASILEVDRLSE